MVITIHFDVWFIPMGEFTFTLPYVTRVCVEALCVVCVNCFLIISGWYGIKLSFKSVWRMAEQLFVVFVPFYFLSCFFGKDVLSVNRLTESLMVFSSTNYFVQDYMMLLFLSPVLNAFVEKYRTNMLKWVLMFAFLLFWMGCVRQKNDLLFLHMGQNTIHFVLVYLLARTAAEYRDVIMAQKTSFYLLVYGVCTVVLVLMAALKVRWWFYYINPVVLISSFSLFFAFLNMSIKSSVVNFFAASSFSAFLIHTTQPALDFLRDLDNWLFVEFPFPVFFFMMIGVVLGVYLSSVFYDKLMRGIILAPVGNFVYSKISNLNFMQKNLLER